MTLLFDQNISFRITPKLSSLFPDCKHVSDCGLMDMEDSEIWEYAKLNNYSIVTFDSDFYDISILNGHPPKIIWIRTGNLKTIQIAELLVKNKELVMSFLGGKESVDISCLELEA
jgi:predicted nuclease of predicted toxin-antitoxin system